MEKKLDLIACACHFSDGRKYKIGGFLSKPNRAKSKTLSPE
jgi:hypothetical protein